MTENCRACWVAPVLEVILFRRRICTSTEIARCVPPSSSVLRAVHYGPGPKRSTGTNRQWGGRRPERGPNKIGTQTVRAADKQINKAWFFAVLSLAVFSALSAVFIVPPLLVEIASDLDVSVPVAGQLATATFAAWAVSLLTVGPLSDSFGRRPVALIGLLVLSVSVLASAFAPNIEVLLALRVLTGLAGGTLPPTAVGGSIRYHIAGQTRSGSYRLVGPQWSGFGHHRPNGGGVGKLGWLAGSLPGCGPAADISAADELDLVSARQQ